MSEDRDEATGQFTSAEPLYGVAGLEHDAGYVPFQEEPKEEPEELTVAEAAERYNSRTAEADVKTYGPIDLPDNVSLTVEQAHKIHSDIKDADQAQADQDEADKLRAKVDKLRGVDPEANAEAKPEVQPEMGADPKADVEKFLAIPHVKEAVERFSSETDAVRQQYSQAVDVANEFARASFMENFPEIAALPLPQWEGALAAMAQREPDRFNKAVNSLQRVVQLQTAQQHQQEQRAESERVRLQAESAHFEESLKDVPKARRAEIEGEIVGALKERGANMADVVKFLRSNEASSASVMGLLWELGEARRELKAIKSAPKAVASRHVPAVQRPGVAPSKGDRNAASLAELTSRLDRTGDVKDALALYNARRSNRGR